MNRIENEPYVPTWLEMFQAIGRTAVLVIVMLVLFILLVVLAPHVFPDPAQQVRDGYHDARAACAAGKARTADERQLCSEL